MVLPAAINVLITGAAKGIGLELAKQFALHETMPPRYNVIATVHETAEGRADDISALASKIANLTVIRLDTTSDESIVEAVRTVEQQLGLDHLDLLINNAGVLYPVPEEDTFGQVKRDGFLRVLETNVAGTLAVSQAFLPLLRKSIERSGDESGAPPTVVNISSNVGSNVSGAPKWGPRMITYGASKAAITYITSACAATCKDILFLAVHPGWVQTDMGYKLGDAPVPLSESVAGIRHVICSRTLKDSGKFINYKNEELPF